MEEEKFFTNRELFDRFTEKIDELSKELAETQRVVKAYNGLRKQLNDVCKVVDGILSEGAGKNKLASSISWAIGVIGALIGIAGGILVIASRL